jgi:hypothetical protein
MRSILRRQPAVVVSLLFCLVILVMYSTIVRQTGGTFVYPLDDSYIHLTLARTLAQHHVWGISASSFASASSSPGWTLLLAITDVLIGSHLLNGIGLDVIFAIALLFAVDYGIQLFVPSVKLWFRYLALLVVLFCTPLTSLTMIGMEHVAQTLSILLFVVLAIQVLALDPGQPAPGTMVIPLLIIAIFAGAIRYEAVFAVVPICVCLVLRRRITLAVAVGLCTAIAPIAFGLYFHRESGLWLPFSVIAKASERPPATLKYFFDQTLGFRSLVPAIVLIWLLRFRRLRFWHSSQLLLFFAGCITVLHLAVASVGWLMRYESYLVALCIFSLCVVAAEAGYLRAFIERIGSSSLRRRSATALLVILGLGISFIMTVRAVGGIAGTVSASNARFMEHTQLARLVSGAYDHDTIVVNDIGAISFYSHAHLLDLAGLGSIQPVRAIREKHPFIAVDADSWASSQHASIAILHTQWPLISRVIPPTWTKVQTWTIPVFEVHDVGFFAVTPEDIPRLCASLARFPPPSQVKVTSFSPGCLSTISRHPPAGD